MSLLVLVRHGQTAEAFTGTYRDLTPRGRAQARHVGRALADEGLVPDQVFLGPAERHRQTWQAAAEAAREAGVVWPAPTHLAELDEHQGREVFVAALEALQRDEGVLANHDHDLDPSDGRSVLKAFRQVLRAWAHGDVAAPEHAESWPAFLARVDRGLSSLAPSRASRRVHLAFTSGGFVGAATALVLTAADPAAALDTGMEVRNGSLTRVRFSGPRRTLVSFNEVDHLPESERTHL